jgi:hypothetical protein
MAGQTGEMSIRRLSRDTEGVESLKFYASLDTLAGGNDLRDPDRVQAFLTRIEDGLTRSLATESRLSGLQAEALFRAVVVALGGFELLTDEDAGDPYFDDAGGPVKPPDFRIVRANGQQRLIEVKRVSDRKPLEPHRLRAKEVSGLRRYGELMGVPIAIAHYWTAWNLWTVVDLDALSRRGQQYEIDLKRP